MQKTRRGPSVPFAFGLPLTPSLSDPPPQVASRFAIRTSSAGSNASQSPHSSLLLRAFVPPQPGSFQTSRLAQPSMLALQASKCQSGIVPLSLLLSC